MMEIFRDDNSGTTAVMFALGMLSIAAFSGIALDYSVGVSAKAKNQAALDAAVLAATTAASSQASAEAAIAKYYAANGGKGRIHGVTFSETASGRTLAAKASFEKTNAFGALVGAPKMDVRVASEAGATARLTELTIEPISAGGAWSKRMTLHKIDEMTGADMNLGYINYEFGKTNAYTGTVTTNLNGAVSLLNAREAYFQMDIVDDPNRSWFTDEIERKVMRTNDTSTSHFVFVNGVQLRMGVAVNLADIIPCGQQVVVAWEDGGDFAVQDFFFKVTGKCTITNGSQAHLKR